MDHLSGANQGLPNPTPPWEPRPRKPRPRKPRPYWSVMCSGSACALVSISVWCRRVTSSMRWLLTSKKSPLAPPVEVCEESWGGQPHHRPPGTPTPPSLPPSPGTSLRCRARKPSEKRVTVTLRMSPRLSTVLG